MHVILTTVRSLYTFDGEEFIGHHMLNQDEICTKKRYLRCRS